MLVPGLSVSAVAPAPAAAGRGSMSPGTGAGIGFDAALDDASRQASLAMERGRRSGSTRPRDDDEPIEPTAAKREQPHEDADAAAAAEAPPARRHEERVSSTAGAPRTGELPATVAGKDAEGAEPVETAETPFSAAPEDAGGAAGAGLVQSVGGQADNVGGQADNVAVQAVALAGTAGGGAADGANESSPAGASGSATGFAGTTDPSSRASRETVRQGAPDVEPSPAARAPAGNAVPNDAAMTAGAADEQPPLHEAGRTRGAGERSPGDGVEAGARATRGGDEARGSTHSGERAPEAHREGARAAMPADAAATDEGGDQDGQDQSREANAQAQPRDGGAVRASARAFHSTLAIVQGADALIGAAGIPAAAPAGASTPAAMSPQERTANLAQLVQSMQVLVRNGIGEATVRLRPEHLGEVSISIRVEGRSVAATIRAESAGVREWLQSQEDALRAGLAHQGLSLDRLVVQRDARHERGEQEPPDQRRQRPRPRTETPERFEVSA